MSCAVQERWASCIRFWSSIWGSVLEFCSTLARRRCGIGGGHSPPCVCRDAASSSIVVSHSCRLEPPDVPAGRVQSAWRFPWAPWFRPEILGGQDRRTPNLVGEDTGNPRHTICVVVVILLRCFPSELLLNLSLFWVWLKELNFFLNMTQRIEPLFKIWLKELNLFEHDSKNWTFFTWLKNWTFFWTWLKELNHLFEYESKDWTF